jgi:hypothetical protein
VDTRRIGRLEQELRSLALDNAFGRVGDDYLRRKATLTAEIEDARQPRPSPGSVDPARALAWLEDLRSLWEVELPEAPEHGATRREYELRRAEATASAFDRLEAPGPVIVEAKVADDLLIGRSLVLALAPGRAELTGEKAAVMQQLIGGRRSRLIRSDTTEARKKRHQRSPEGTIGCIGRGERRQTSTTDLIVPATWRLQCRAIGGLQPEDAEIGAADVRRERPSQPSTTRIAWVAPSSTNGIAPSASATVRPSSSLDATPRLTPLGFSTTIA